MTATTAPRLRMGNGFKVWHYSGALLHETVWPTGQELLQVIWQKYADGVFTEKPISNVKVTGIQPSQPQSSKAVYVPPNIRSGGGGSTLPIGASPRSSNQASVERGPIPGLPIGYKVSQGQRKKDARNAKRKENENPKQNTTLNSSANQNATNEEGKASQAAQNQVTPTPNNKRNQRRTPRQPNNQNHTNGNGSNAQNNTDSTNTPNANANNATATQPNEEQPSANGAEAQKRRPRNRQRKSEGGAGGTSGDPEKDKRIRTVQQKLRDIAKLKVRRDNGDNLEVNQLSKIGLEADLIKELNSLKVEA